jgi:hypothetical protein
VLLAGEGRYFRGAGEPGIIGEVQLVRRRAATEPELLAQGRIGEQIDDRAADDQVLLDLPLLCPRNDVALCDDVHHRNHSSLAGGDGQSHATVHSVLFSEGIAQHQPPESVRVQSTEGPSRDLQTRLPARLLANS